MVQGSLQLFGIGQSFKACQYGEFIAADSSGKTVWKYTF